MVVVKNRESITIRNWVAQSPYRLLKNVDISPQSSMKQIKKASLEMLGSSASAAEKLAVEDIRLISKRLFADFFLFQVSPERVLFDLQLEDLQAYLEKFPAKENQEKLVAISEAMQKEFKSMNLDDLKIKPLKFD